MAGPDEDAEAAAAAPSPDDGAGEPGFDPAARELCPDGNCTGVIGDDGRCKVCGLAGTGGVSHRAAARAGGEGVGEDDAAPSDEVNGRPDGADGEDDELGEEESASPADDGAADLDDRQLCPDGNCVGVIGPDGICKVCGLPASAVP